jgi:hypothetical protein
MTRPDHAFAKIKLALKRIDELADRITRDPPFTYVLESDYRTGHRSTFAKRDEALIIDCALQCGDVLQALRTSLDYAFWDIVGPFAKTTNEERAIQFPFSETAARLPEVIKKKLAHRVGPSFYNAIVGLAPHGEEGGNKLLYLINKLNVSEKHRSLTPIGEFKLLSADHIRRQVPDFPLTGGEIRLGMSARDVMWPFSPPLGSIGSIVEQRLDAPIVVALPIDELGCVAPMISTLKDFARVAENAIETIRVAAV